MVVQKHSSDDEAANSAGPFGGEASPAFWGRAEPPNGQRQPPGGCGESNFATELTEMRVEPLKSRKLTRSAERRVSAAFAFAQRICSQSAFPLTFSRPADQSISPFDRLKAGCLNQIGLPSHFVTTQAQDFGSLKSALPDSF